MSACNTAASLTASVFDFAQQRLTRKQAADYLGTSLEFLEADAVTKRHGIPFYKIGRRVFYSRPELDAWIASRRVCPSPDALNAAA